MSSSNNSAKNISNKEVTTAPPVEIGERLKQLEEKEKVTVESEDDDGGAKTEDEYYDEEIEEELGDYQQSYFDPGDEFDNDEDDTLEDGPLY